MRVLEVGLGDSIINISTSFIGCKESGGMRFLNF